MSIKVTIGVCVKNSEKTVRQAVKSIINQKYPHKLMRLVVVDDGSTDNTLAMVRSAISETDVQTKVYSEGGKGLGRARQTVVAHADGKYIIFVDGDVEVFDDFVQEQVEFIERNPEVGAAVGRHIYRGGNTLICQLRDLHFSAAYDQFPGANCATIYRSEALQQVGGYDENIKGASEDLDLVARMRAKGWTLSVNKRARFYHKPRESLKAFLFQQVWYGYGLHYLTHKHANPYLVWQSFPLFIFVSGLGLASRLYKLTCWKISFLTPFMLAFGKAALWFGFLKGHLDHYGHTHKREF